MLELSQDVETSKNLWSTAGIITLQIQYLVSKSLVLGGAQNDRLVEEVQISPSSLAGRFDSYHNW